MRTVSSPWRVKDPVGEVGYPGKRALDLAIAIPALLVLSPVLAVVSWLVSSRLGAPVFFTQRRPGLYERPFRIIKFRTMSDGRGADGQLMPDVDRQTRLGRSLRLSSIDELPELINVIRGDMSLVGPRPLLEEYLPYYSVRERSRFLVRPGITGWAQVNGRNDVHWDRRLELDAWYVEHCSLSVDLKILARTIGNVLRREGAYAVSGPVEENLAEQRSSRRATLDLGGEG